MCQKDFLTIKTEYDLIQEEIKTERQNVSQLHEQNKLLHEELEEQKKKEVFVCIFMNSLHSEFLHKLTFCFDGININKFLNTFSIYPD